MPDEGERYAAPEVLLGSTQYGPEVDLWSVGCIFAELAKRRPLFEASHPGASALELLINMFQVLGTPDEEVWPGVSQLEGWHEYPQWRAPSRASLAAAIPTLGPSGIDLLLRLLMYDPSRRITAREALRHEYFADMEDREAIDALEAPYLEAVAREEREAEVLGVEAVDMGGGRTNCNKRHKCHDDAYVA